MNEKAVAVAQDVLKHLEVLNIVTGEYLCGYLDHKLEGDMQGCADEVTKFCNVCALGALMLSKARLYNAVPMGDVIYSRYYIHDKFYLHADRSVTVEHLADIFSPEQSDLIEAAFELSDGNQSTSVKCLNAIVFGKHYLDDRPGRVRAIMQNIIDNNGEFKP